MNLMQLKCWVNKLSDEELKQELLYNSERLSISGPVDRIIKSKYNLYYTGEDDPAQLYTKSELKGQEMEKEEIELLSIEIPKGGFYISF